MWILDPGFRGRTLASATKPCEHFCERGQSKRLCDVALRVLFASEVVAGIVDPGLFAILEVQPMAQVDSNILLVVIL